MLLLVLLLTPTPGCISSGSKGFSLLPQGNRLLDSSKEMREANSRPLAVARELEKQPLPSFTVEPGDALIVQPVDLDSPARLPADQPVLPDGTINLGKYGQHLVAGRTVAEIQEIVKAAVETQTKNAGFISVRLISRQSKVYYVLGEVNAPGVFQLSGRETVLDAILAAGGLTDRASRNNIILTRPSKPDQPRTVLPVCYRQIVQLGDTTTNYQIGPGDRIYVPSRTTREMLFGECCDKSPCSRLNEHGACVLPPYSTPSAPHSEAPPALAPLPLAPLPLAPPAMSAPALQPEVVPPNAKPILFRAANR
jgi:polysaccharide export outer membrane protein